MKIGMTGVTGFVGSSIATALLKNGHSVIALSRRDPDGNRTRLAVRQAWEGFGYGDEFINQASARLDVVNTDFQDLTHIRDDLLKKIESFIHVAGDMSYEVDAFHKAFQSNVVITENLYKVLALNARNCREFIQISTAYTTGFHRGGRTFEQLHPAPEGMHVYQTTKWMAEQQLKILSDLYDLPVVVMRLSAVMGHSRTGWYGVSPYAIYALWESFMKCALDGVSEVRVPLKPDSHVNIIPVDVVSDRVASLVSYDSRAPECFYPTMDRIIADERVRTDNSRVGLRVMHNVADAELNVKKCLDLFSEVAGIKVLCGVPETLRDKALYHDCERHLRYVDHSWDFDRTQIRSFLGNQYREFAMDEETMRVLLKHFCHFSRLDRGSVRSNVVA